MLERPPFTATRTEEERAKDKGRHMTIRLNAEEAAWLEEVKEVLDTESDGATMKLCAALGWRVLQNDLGADTLRWLSRRDRSRYWGEKKPSQG